MKHVSGSVQTCCCFCCCCYAGATESSVMAPQGCRDPPCRTFVFQLLLELYFLNVPGNKWSQRLNRKLPNDTRKMPWFLLRASFLGLILNVHNMVDQPTSLTCTYLHAQNPFMGCPLSHRFAMPKPGIHYLNSCRTSNTCHTLHCLNLCVCV